MIMKIKVFESQDQKILYIEDINFYFNISEVNSINVGDYYWDKNEFSEFICYHKNDLKDLITYFSILEENMKKKQVDFESMKGIGFTLCLHPSRRCNLNCKYCFKNSNYLVNEPLSFEMARMAIDYFVFDYAKRASKYIIDLSGSGEPLIEFDLIKQIVDYCDDIQNKIGKSVSVMFATNAVQLSEEKLNYIDNNLTIGFSLDGDKCINDENRCLPNGEGTYDFVVNTLKSLKNKKVGIASTITPKHQEVDMIYDHLVNLPNIDCISMKLIRCFDNSELDFSNFNIPYLISRYKKLCNNIFANFDTKNFDYIKPLLCGNDMFGKFIKRCLHHNYINSYPCDAGINRISIDSFGNIYSCSVLLGEKNSCLGNIFDGVDRSKQLKYLVSSNKKSKICNNCWARYICGGECYAISFSKYKKQYYPYKEMCLFRKELIKLSMGFVSKLSNSYPEYYKKIVNYEFETMRYEDSDSALWAISQFLQSRGYNIAYSEITKNITASVNGVDIEKMLEFAHRYDDSIKAYTINSERWPQNLIYPLISLVNKMNNSIYLYLMIIGEDKEFLYIKSIFDYEPKKMSKSEFLKKTSNIIIF